jgi:hypothetical protein
MLRSFCPEGGEVAKHRAKLSQPPNPPSAEVKLTVRIDETAEPGDGLGALARLLRRLRDRARAEASVPTRPPAEEEPEKR